MNVVGEETTLVGKVERDRKMIDNTIIQAAARTGTLIPVNGKEVEVGQMGGQGVGRMALGTGKMAQRG